LAEEALEEVDLVEAKEDMAEAVEVAVEDMAEAVRHTAEEAAATEEVMELQQAAATVQLSHTDHTK